MSKGKVKYPISYQELLEKGLTLLPGHIISVDYIRRTYKENLLFTDRDAIDRKYMILETDETGENLLTAPLSVQYIGVPYSYGDKTYVSLDSKKIDLDLVRVWLNEADVTVVHSLVPADVFRDVITLYNSRMKVMEDSEPIEPDILVLPKKKVEVGNIIVVCDPDTGCEKSYFVWHVGRKRGKYASFEVDKNNDAVTDSGGNVQISYFDKAQDILRVDKLGKNKVDSLSSYLPFSRPILDSVVRVKFRKGSNWYLICAEKDGEYACVDVTNGINSINGKIVFFPSTTPLLDATSIPKRLCAHVISKVKKKIYDKKAFRKLVLVKGNNNF